MLFGSKKCHSFHYFILLNVWAVITILYYFLVRRRTGIKYTFIYSNSRNNNTFFSLKNKLEEKIRSRNNVHRVV